MRPRLLLAALALLAVATPAVAQNPRPRAQLLDAPLPLSLNLGGGVNSRSGAAVFDLFGAIQTGVNALNALRGQPNGIATLDANGLLSASQIPLSLGGGTVTGSAAGLKALLTGDGSDLLVVANASGGVGTFGRLFSDLTFARITAGGQTMLGETDSPVNQYVGNAGVQSTWRSRQSMFRTAPAGPRSDYAYIGNNITLLDPGSQVNGPANAGYGQNISILKQGYPATSSNNGELDALLINVRQSGPTPAAVSGASDTNGIQMNVQQAGDPGFAALIEGLASRIDATAPYAETQGVRIQIGVIDPFGKNGEQGQTNAYAGVNRLSFGYAAIADVGSLDRAFYAVDSGGTWSDYIYAGRPGNPAFRVKGTTGDIVLGTDDIAWTIHREGTGTLQFKSSNGTVQAAFYSSGIGYVSTMTTNSVQVSGTTMLTARNTVVFPPQTSVPSNPVVGETYFDQSLATVRTFDGNTWHNLY